VRLAREELPARCLTPARDDSLVAEVEGVFEVQQRDHGAQGNTRPCDTAGARAAYDLLGKKVQIGPGFTGVDAAGKGLGYPRFKRLPGHVRDPEPRATPWWVWAHWIPDGMLPAAPLR